MGTGWGGRITKKEFHIYIYMSIEEPNSNIVQKTSAWKSNQVYKHMYVMFCINKDGKKTDLRIYIVFPGQYI